MADERGPTTPGPVDLHTTYIWLEGDDAAVPEVVDAGFWQRLGDRDTSKRRLMGLVRATPGHSDWEVHPYGDEVLLLLSGSADVVLGEAQVARLQPGTFCIVPRGVWHRQVFHEDSRLLFVTPGDATQHAPFELGSR